MLSVDCHPSQAEGEAAGNTMIDVIASSRSGATVLAKALTRAELRRKRGLKT